jgi:hypothetical protein
VEILNLGSAAEDNAPAPKARKKLRVILGIGALAAVTGLGSTLAANISLNGGGNVEFGQGVATTAACDDDITLTPVSEFSNTSYGYDEATFTMTAIQVSGIDLTPEGWDVQNNGWATGWDVNANYGDGGWSADYQQYSGQYKDINGAWTNTCANKSLMLRAYTDKTEYANRTSDDNISSPLLLNGQYGQRPNLDTVGGYNSGVGFRFITYSDGPNDYDSDYWDIADDDGYAADLDPIYIDVNTNGDNFWENSTVVVYLDDDSDNPPADSRWIDKVTIESAATTPNGWITNF